MGEQGKYRPAPSWFRGLQGGTRGAWHRQPLANGDGGHTRVTGIQAHVCIRLAYPHVQYTAPVNFEITLLAAPGPGYAVATEADLAGGKGRFLEWAPALPKFRNITAVGLDGSAGTPIFPTASAKAELAAQSGAHALAAIFMPDAEAAAPEPNSELVSALHGTATNAGALCACLRVGRPACARRHWLSRLHNVSAASACSTPG